MTKIPPAPKGTGPRGRALWRDVLERYELDRPERVLLEEAVRCADTLDELQAAVDRDGAIVADRFGQDRPHPAAVEARQLRVTLARIIAALRIPEDRTEAAGRPQRRTGFRGVHHLGSVS